MASITVRDVPEDVRAELAARAARAGRSLHEHLGAGLIELARRPSAEEWLEHVRRRKATTGTHLDRERIVAHRDARSPVTLALDASTLVTALVDDGPDGRWAETLIAREPLAAPHLTQVEAATILRRAVLAGDLSEGAAALAHDDLLTFRVQLFPYEPFTQRVWQPRHDVTSYHAWHVALAETLGAALATLDGRLLSASGPRWAFESPRDPR